MSAVPTYTESAREALAAQLLALSAESIDITPTQYERAKKAYRTISDVITSGAEPELRGAEVFPQGSFAIGTVVRPLVDEDGEFDVDLACRLNATTALPPARAKAIIGNRLAQDDRYAQKLKEKSRCWRIEYAGEFHLDVCPLVRADASNAIPDKQLAQWILTHPQAYATWFNNLADRARTAMLVESMVVKADVAQFPEENPDKGWLRRLVQLLKRHRDIWASQPGRTSAEFAPISIIIATLAATAAERVLSSGLRFDNPYRLMQWIVAKMPEGIQHHQEMGGVVYWVKSPVANENFANRWNEDRRWSESFYQWHHHASADISKLLSATGLDRARPILEESFGARVAKSAIDSYAQSMRASRDSGALRFVPATGGLIVSTEPVRPIVPQHTFFGG